MAKRRKTVSSKQATQRAPEAVETVEAKAALIVAEFGSKLDTPLILSLVNDYDLSIEGHEDILRASLELLAQENATTDELSQPAGGARPGETTASTSSYMECSTPADSVSMMSEVSDLSDESCPEELKLAHLQAMFPNLGLFDVQTALKKCQNSIHAASDCLLNIQYLEDNGERKKGVDAFAVDEDNTTAATKPGKKKGKGKGRAPRLQGRLVSEVLSGQTPTSSSSSQSAGQSPPESPPELTYFEESQVKWLSQKLNLVEAEVIKVFVANDRELPNTIECFIDVFMDLDLHKANSSGETDTVKYYELQATNLLPGFPTIPVRYLVGLYALTENPANIPDLARELAKLFRAGSGARVKLNLMYSLTPSSAEIEGGSSISTLKPNTVAPTPKAPPQRRQSWTPGTNFVPVVGTTLGSNIPQRPPSGFGKVQHKAGPSGWTKVPGPNGKNNSSGGPSTTKPTAASLRAATGQAREKYEASRETAANALRKGTSNPVWKAAAAVYSQKMHEHRKEYTSAQADEKVHGTVTANSVDLHHVYVGDAVRIAQQEAQNWWRRDGRAQELRVITGRGKHSDGGKSKLKPAVREMLAQGGWRFEEEEAAFILLGKRY